jgi:hypothetical protein
MSGIISDNQGRSSGLVKAAAAGGGAWNLVLAQTISSNVGEVEFTDSHFTSTYDFYKVVIISGVPEDENDRQLRMRLSYGGSYVTAAEYDWGYSGLHEGDHNRGGDDSGTSFYITGDDYNVGGNNGESFNAEVTIYNPLSTDSDKLVTATTAFTTDLVVGMRTDFMGRLNDSDGDALDAFKFYMNSGDIISGSFILYGLSKS